MQDRQHTLRTPKQRMFVVLSWKGLPYVMKKELSEILKDLPEVRRHVVENIAKAARQEDAVVTAEDDIPMPPAPFVPEPGDTSSRKRLRRGTSSPEIRIDQSDRYQLDLLCSSRACEAMCDCHSRGSTENNVFQLNLQKELKSARKQ